MPLARPCPEDLIVLEIKTNKQTQRREAAVVCGWMPSISFVVGSVQLYICRFRFKSRVLYAWYDPQSIGGFGASSLARAGPASSPVDSSQVPCTQVEVWKLEAGI